MERENPRELALSILNRKADSGGPSGGILDELFHSGSHLSQRDRAFLNHLVQGVLRWRLRLDWIIERNSHFSIRKIAPPVLNLLRIALYQIFFMDRVPDSAAVNEAVSQAKRIGPRHIVPFVNGLLRNVCRKKEEQRLPDEEKDPLLYRAVRYSYPQWLIRMWDEDWGAEFTDQLLAAGNEIPGITLRTNRLKTGRDELLARLVEEGVQGSPCAYSPDGIRLTELKGRIDRLESFKEGLFQVQDEAAQICTRLLDPGPGERVLDVCAGYGGKASHIAERMNDGGMIAALDISFRRLVNLRDNAARLSIRSINPVAGDGSKDLSHLLRGKWDKILVDAPCSGLGVVSRHPDIKWNRKEDDLGRLAKLQSTILTQAFSLLRKGGRLLYVTCTLSRKENEWVVRSLLKSESDARLKNPGENAPDWCRDLVDENGFFRTFPHKHKMDGFFGALFQRS
ncbi:MAG: 16S rRNA (cytosine(967)-C(5))-methyltransferase RsmB [Desulfobacteraceae bacterium]|nr:MAG: 16S rRNA (cytosine(967)-C(5))-methyltransferase RsmB [Desulfobacteraceae bacterium]